MLLEQAKQSHLESTIKAVVFILKNDVQEQVYSGSTQEILYSRGTEFSSKLSQKYFNNLGGDIENFHQKNVLSGFPEKPIKI